MQEMNPLEKQLRSWTPRRPSAKIARRLFAKAAPATVFLRRREVWHWLTPVAACALTLVVAVHSASRHLPRLNSPDNASFFATVIFDAATSNVQHTFVLSKTDENMEWNVWPHPLPVQMARRTEPCSSLNIWSVIPTNR
jgi:hypothetical protein